MIAIDRVRKEFLPDEKHLLSEGMAESTFQLLEHCQLKIERTAEKLNLTVTEFKLLRAFHRDEVVSIGDTAKRVRLSNSRLTGILDGLVGKGIVRRETVERDRRAIDIHRLAKQRIAFAS